MGQDIVVFTAEDILIGCGDDFTINILVENFTDIQGFQFTLQFDESVLNYQNFQNEIGIPVMNVNESLAGSGILPVQWFGTAPVTLPDGSAIITFNFEYTGDCSEPTAIEIVENPVAIEVVSEDFMSLPYRVEMGIVGIDECDVNVNAGNDTLLCAGTNELMFDPAVEGIIVDQMWSPPNGLDDPSLLNPTATVTGPATYSLSVRSVTDNLIYNGDFENGHIGFSSDYDFDDIMGLIDEGTYTITASPEAVSSTFPPCVDHTSGSGNMMLINGDNLPGQNVWCQQVSVTPNTDYYLEAWVATAVPIGPAMLQFSVNGNFIGPVFNASDTPCDWMEMNTEWNAAADSQVTLCIVNQNNAFPGNDFALDDIGFYGICSATDDLFVDVLDPINTNIDTVICEGENVMIGDQSFSQSGQYSEVLTSAAGCDSTVDLTLEVIELQADIFAPDQINCDQPQIQLDGGGSSQGSNIEYVWNTLDGNIVSGQGTSSITIDRGGTYTLIVRFNDGSISCESEEAVVFVNENLSTPGLSLDTLPVFECGDSSLQIRTTPDYAGIEADWTTFDGEIIGGEQSFNPVVGRPGTYIVELFDPASGCDTTFSFLVEGTADRPLAIISGDSIISCGQDNTLLTANGSSEGPDFSYFWYTTDGNISGPSDGDSISISSGGTYFLVVSHNTSDCADTTAIAVETRSGFDLSLESSGTVLNCLQSTISLSAVLTNAEGDLTYRWQRNGMTVSSGTDSTFLADLPANYSVEVVNADSSCSASDSVEITADLSTPSFDLGPPMVLDCSIDSHLLNGPILAEPDLTYNWTSPDGEIISNHQSRDIFIGRPGTYFLEIVDISSGCSSDDSIVVLGDSDLPVVVLAVDTIFSCTIESVLISSSGSDFGADFEYQWSTVGGLYGDITDSSATALQAGSYTLEIRDTTNNCSAAATIDIGVDSLRPIISAGPDLQLDCSAGTARLEGSAAHPDSVISINWSSNSGGIVADGESLEPLVSEAGQYILTVSFTQSGCESTDTVEVFPAEDPPNALIVEPDSIDCESSTVSLDGSLSDSGSPVVYEWFSSNGNIVSGTDQAVALADQPGLYILTVTDTSTGCFGRDSTRVIEDLYVSEFTSPDSLFFNCVDTSAFIRITFTANADHDHISWSTTDGIIAGGASSEQIEIEASGTYVVTVENTRNGCRRSDTTFASFEGDVPFVDAGPDMDLACEETELMLDGSNSDSGPGIEYSWSSPDGNIVSGADSAMATVNSPGIYILLLENRQSGCNASDTVIVDAPEPISLEYMLVPPDCEEAEAMFEILSIEGGQPPYLILLDSQSVQSGQLISGLEAGTHVLIAEGETGCAFADTFVINAVSGIDLSLPPVFTVQAGEEIVLEAIAGLPPDQIDSISWEPADGLSCTDCLDPVLTVADNAVYRIQVWSEDGCTAVAQTQIRIDRNVRIYIPTAFSPNGDGVNDFLTAYSNRPDLLVNEFYVFDRWGNKVHERLELNIADPTLAWNGRFKGKVMNPGVFIYYLEIILPDQSTRIIKGSCTLIR